MFDTVAHIASLVAFCYLLAALFLRPRVPVVAVPMVDTAHPSCSHCHGTGWYADYPDRCMIHCGCRADIETPKPQRTTHVRHAPRHIPTARPLADAGL